MRILGERLVGIGLLLSGIWLLFGALALAFTTEGAVLFYLGACLTLVGLAVLMGQGLAHILRGGRDRTARH
jgi:hypothetical protein